MERRNFIKTAILGASFLNMTNGLKAEEKINPANKKTVIITGANSGLGFETAKKIASHSNEFEVILACRNLEKAKIAGEQIIKESNNNNVIPMQIDTSSLKSVKNFVDNYKTNHNKPIYALLCNAGIVGVGNENVLSEDGFDIVFATNHLGHFLLTNSLLPLIQEKGKIISTSSDMHYPNPMLKEGETFEWLGVEALAHPDEKMAKSPQRYPYSKLCNLYFTYELARILKKQNSSITANAFNPGLMKTNLSKGRRDDEFFESIKINYPERYGNLETSSAALAELVYSEEIILSSAHFYDRSTRPCFSSELSYKKENAKELWDKSLEYVQKYL